MRGAKYIIISNGLYKTIREIQRELILKEKRKISTKRRRITLPMATVELNRRCIIKNV